VNFVDSQGSAKLAELARVVQAEGVELRLARVKPQVRAVLEADGVLDQIGRDHIHGNVQRAVRTQLEAPSTGRRRPTP
jgi:anti-anti-sigma regulatory factor